MRESTSWKVTSAMVLGTLLLVGAPLAAQTPDTGDVFGDLVHIQRNAGTGQPILAQRWVELPGPVPGYGWGYCPIAVDAFGAEIAFIPYTCDPLDPTAVVDVDYFGRLNASRTRERNNRMHFDEVITTIKSADWVNAEGSGRLRLFFDCTVPGNPTTCLSWKVIDSPMENLGLYTRLIKYGHLQTDPLEVDTGAHGDPSIPVVYHPALAAEDWAKMDPSVHHLLPDDGSATCFAGGVFLPSCAAAEFLGSRDLVRATGFVGGAADKTGSFTPDLVQYLGRIMKLTQDTETTVATLATLPALVRDCWPPGEDPQSPGEDDPAPVDPPYLPLDQCVVSPADPSLPNYETFPDVMEHFVDFSPIDYDREAWRSELVNVILPIDVDLYRVTYNLSLLPWLQVKNGFDGPSNIKGFVLAANDSLRWIEFIHNYEVPDDLFAGVDPIIFMDGFESGDTSGWSATAAYLSTR